MNSIDSSDLKFNIVQWISARIHRVMLQTRNNKHCMNTSLLLNSHWIKDEGNLSSNAIQCPWKSKVFSNYSKDKICERNQNCIRSTTLKYSSEKGFMVLADEIKSLGLKDQRTHRVRHVSTLVAFISRNNIWQTRKQGQYYIHFILTSKPNFFWRCNIKWNLD